MVIRLPFGLTLQLMVYLFRRGTNLSLRCQTSFCIKSLIWVHFSCTKVDWCWRHDPCGLFSVKPAYLVFEDRARLQRTILGNDFANLQVFGILRLCPKLLSFRGNSFRIRSLLTTFSFLLVGSLLFGIMSLGVIAPAPSMSVRCNIFSVRLARRGEVVVPGCFQVLAE
ncbi:hypothetical protein L195_g036109 [Trifolium pratense]|uniref:Uncharacterized protein n=1 Tax=Trifolium pratense TaxID=57577 RepID=A0A2K3LNK3_TRIPR|nr:hypothetical protein L195_g036109 [Trifolium pratense]